MRLLVIPSDPLSAYSNCGYLSRLIYCSYFNPANVFDEVIIASPYEPAGERLVGPYRVIGVPRKSFSSFIKTLSPDLIRAYGSFWACDLAVYQSSEVPVFVSVHDTNPKLFYYSIRFADTVMCVSDATRIESLKHGVQEAHCHVVSNWVDLDYFFPCKDAPQVLDLKKKYPGVIPVLHVGRKEYEKNLETMINALKYLPEKIHVFFVGRGHTQGYADIAQSIGVSSRCHWIDSIPSEELKYWFSWCSCMCTPSRWEGFGVVFIEAAACATPIVTSNIAPLNEIFTHEKNALLVNEYESPQILASNVLRVCENGNLADFLRYNALEMVKNRFSRVTIQEKEAELMISTVKKYNKCREKRLIFKLNKKAAKIANDTYHALRDLRNGLLR